MDGAHPDLLHRARAGEEIALDALFGPLIEPAFRLAFGLLHDRQLAEDAVQEAALRAWHKLSQLRDGAGIRPWFLAFVANQCRNMRRSSWLSVVRTDNADGRTHGFEERVVAGADLKRAIKDLSYDHRLAIVLHFYLDLPLDEVATITGVPLGTVKSRLHRAEAQLRLHLQLTEGIG